jgi:hypothetical protein
VCPRTSYVWQHFTMTPQGWSGSHISLVHIFHVISHTGLSVGGSYTTLVYISRGMVGYRPTTTIIKLCQSTLRDNMWLVLFNYLLNGSTTIRSSIDISGGLPPCNLEYTHPSPQPSYLMLICFPLVAPPGLKLNLLYNSSNQNLSKTTSVKKGGPTCE